MSSTRGFWSLTQGLCYRANLISNSAKQLRLPIKIQKGPGGTYLQTPIFAPEE